jgi:hypothetical protein
MKETPISKDGLAQKLRALQNMTVANGCTESEALVAAAKAAELLERYGLSLQELKAAAPDHVCGSVADRCIHHAASTLYHTWKGSVPKLSGRPNWPLMIF